MRADDSATRPEHLCCARARGLAQRLLRGAGHVRRQDDVVDRREAGSRSQRFLRQHAQARAEQPTVFQCIGQRLLVDQAATRRVDDDRRGFETRQRVAVQRVARVRAQRPVQRHHVGHRQQFVERGRVACADAFDRRRRRERRPDDDLHPRSLRELRDAAAAVTEADHAERLAVQRQHRRSYSKRVSRRCVAASAAGVRRATASISRIACSATAPTLLVGVLTTGMPRRAACGRSTAS